MSEHHDQETLERGEPRGERSAEEREWSVPRGARAMAILRWGLVLLMAAAAGGSILYYFGKLPSGTARSAKRYHCPMHPTVVQDQPGDCPICGMSLVLIGEGEGHSAHGSASTQAPAASAGAYACPLHPEQTSNDANATCPVCGMAVEPSKGDAPKAKRKVAASGAVYVCPMHPEQSSSDPSARCPLCKMRLERAGGAGEKVSGLVPVTLGESRIQLIGMRTAKVQNETLVSQLRTVGFVSASERGLATVSMRFAGWIEQLQVNQTGERVSRGQVLASIYSPQLLLAQQELLNALRWGRGASAGESGGSLAALEVDARRRLELLGIAPQEIAEIARTGKALRAVKIRAPVSGHVTQKNAVVGLYLQPGASLFELADLSTVWVIAEVYEHEVSRVRLGQPARFELAAFPGHSFAGKVRFLYPTLDASSRTLRIRIELPNRTLKLRPGMYGNAVIDLGEARGLVVPSEAVVDSGEQQYLFVALAGGRFEPRRVTLGARSDGKVQVLSGVSEGETVVTTGNFLIDSESRLRAAIEGQGVERKRPAEAAAGGEQHPH